MKFMNTFVNKFCAPAFFLVLIFQPVMSSALTVLWLNLQEVTSQADTIFRGRLIEKDRILMHGLEVFELTFKIDEVVRPSSVYETVVGGTIVYYTIATPDPAMKEIGLASAFEGVPDYEVGEEGVYFWSAPGSLGLVAPIGLGQGCFRVKLDAAGERVVVNDLNNAGLFRGLSGSSSFKAMALSVEESYLVRKQSQKIYYGDFVSLVKKVAQ
jgi:hypothetical protein